MPGGRHWWTGVVPFMAKCGEHCSSDWALAFQTQIHIVVPAFGRELVRAAPQEARKV